MALSAFDDKSHSPEGSDLDRVLGKTAPLWKRLIADIGERHAPITEYWSFSGAKYGWSLRLKRRDRVVLYMTPQAGSFLVGIVLGEKAVREAKQMALPDSILRLVDDAPRYAEGRGVRISVATRQDLRAIQDLAAAKMAH